ncbi:CPCC family cysteine-rich protein [Streptomyces sp. NPDC008141]|uniref:CPCC family cysteine-rich protein n=1 Tax=Streptomyces sp. NPDC008141 TaxID=3364815 RepID=UPI0036E66110
MAFMKMLGRVEDGPYRCPCCGYVTLAERGGHEICAVCFWEDDGQGDHDADEVKGGPNRGMSLSQGRATFRAMGASEERRAHLVRDPLPHEHPDNAPRCGTGFLYSWTPQSPGK